jgi:ABC-2 type transport system permease protein
MLVWTNAVFRMGWSLSDEKWGGLLDVSLVSRAPLIITMLGKSLALSFFSLLTGAGAFIFVLIASHHTISFNSLPLAVVSLAITLFAIICTGFIFSPITVLLGEPSGLFATVMPFGVACSGFLYPIHLLPSVLQVIARGMPTSWAMESTIMATTGSGSTWEIVLRWGIAFGLSIVYLLLAQLLFRIVERQIRITATLTTL